MSKRRLEGQRALVTGASSGIGRGAAIALAEAGAAVGVNYRSSEGEADEVVETIERAGGRAIAIQADVGDPEGCRSAYDAVLQAFGGIDIVVPNAGIQQDAAFTELTLTQWKRVLDVNLTGVFLCSQAAVRQFRAQGLQSHSRALGKIVMMSSVHQDIPWAGHANYAASKGGLALLMKTMAQELAHEKIRVNAIAPGAIATDINRDAWETEEARTALLKLIPYGRIGEPEDVGRAVVWLASDDADYVVGTTLYVDGGMMLYPEFREGG